MAVSTLHSEGFNLERILFVDDNINRWAEFSAKTTGDIAWADNAVTAIRMLSASHWERVYLDHDLIGVYQDPASPASGSEIVRQIIARCLNPEAQYIVHSHNINAAIAMVDDLENAGFYARYVPFGITNAPSVAEMKQKIAENKLIWFAPDGVVNSVEASGG